jgi:uncharacterized membrane protein YagU involved in acid resistance
MEKRTGSTLGIFVFVVIISGWIGVTVAAGKEILISPKMALSPRIYM